MIIERYRWRVYRHNWSAINGHSDHNGLLIGFNVKTSLRLNWFEYFFINMKLLRQFFDAVYLFLFKRRSKYRYIGKMLYYIYRPCKLILIWRNFHFINFIFLWNFVNIFLYSLHFDRRRILQFKMRILFYRMIYMSVSVHNALGVMETVGKQVQVVSGLGVGGPVGPVGPVGGDLHHHHHPHPHAHPPHPHSHPHGHPHGSHGHSLATSNPGRGQPQPPTSHNQHVSARSTPVQLHR